VPARAELQQVRRCRGCRWSWGCLPCWGWQCHQQEAQYDQEMQGQFAFHRFLRFFVTLDLKQKAGRRKPPGRPGELKSYKDSILHRD
jgi:hypothetical protein